MPKGSKENEAGGTQEQKQLNILLDEYSPNSSSSREVECHFLFLFLSTILIIFDKPPLFLLQT